MLTRPNRYEWFSADGQFMRDQLAAGSAADGDFVKDRALCCHADADDRAEDFSSWCSACVRLYRDADPDDDDDEKTSGGDFVNNCGDGCTAYPIRVEIDRECIMAILDDMGIDEIRIRNDGVGLKFEVRLRRMVQAAVRKYPRTRAFAYDHLARRFVPDEWG